MNSIFKRALSLLLVFVMCISMLPASALAEDAEVTENESAEASQKTEEMPNDVLKTEGTAEAPEEGIDDSSCAELPEDSGEAGNVITAQPKSCADYEGDSAVSAYEEKTQIENSLSVSDAYDITDFTATFDFDVVLSEEICQYSPSLSLNYGVNPDYYSICWCVEDFSSAFDGTVSQQINWLSPNQTYYYYAVIEYYDSESGNRIQLLKTPVKQFTTADEYTELLLDTPVNIAEAGESYVYKFTATEDNVYSFTFDTDSGASYMHFVDDGGSHSNNSDNRYITLLLAGESVYFSVSRNEGSNYGIVSAYAAESTLIESGDIVEANKLYGYRLPEGEYESGAVANVSFTNSQGYERSVSLRYWKDDNFSNESYAYNTIKFALRQNETVYFISYDYMSGLKFNVTLTETATESGISISEAYDVTDTSASFDFDISLSVEAYASSTNCTLLYSTSPDMYSCYGDSIAYGDELTAGRISKTFSNFLPGRTYYCRAQISYYDYDNQKQVILAQSEIKEFKTAGDKYDNLVYKTEGGAVSIIGCEENATGTVTVPDTINGYPVTKIADKAFYQCNGISKIVLPDSITEIGENAFYFCTKLSSINIPANITKLSSCIFMYCFTLRTLELPETVTEIGNNAFYNSGLKYISIPSSVSHIGYYAFSACESLDEIIFNHSSEDTLTIESGAFQSMSVYYQTTLSTKVFVNDTSSINNAISQYDWQTSGREIICCSLESVPEHGVSDGLMYEIDEGKAAIFGCDTSAAGSVTVPGTISEYAVTAINDGAFSYCSDVTGIAIPASVNKIGKSDAFYNASGLKEIIVDTGNENYCSISGILYNKAKTELVRCPEGKSGSITDIPDSVNEIGKSAFYGCENLLRIEIPGGVTVIQPMAFQECLSLQSVVIPETVAEIPSGAFGGCSKLSEIEFGHSAGSELTIGQYAFYAYTGNKLETSIIVPDKNNINPAISNYAWSGSGRTEIYLEKNKINILTQPQSCEVHEGDSATLSVNAKFGGSGELSYLWKSYNKYTEQWEDANDFATSYTESVFTVDDVTKYMNDYRFKCVISAPNGTSVETDEVVITVKQWEVTITSQPESCTVHEGESATLSVTAEYGGDGELSYLWKSYNKYTKQWEDANDFNAVYTNSTFTVNDVTTYMNDYKFKCIITAPNGTSVETDEVNITVMQWEISISSQPQSCTVHEGESAILSVTAEYGGSGELTYLWKSYNKYTKQWEDANDFATSYTDSSFTVDDVTKYMNDYKFKCVITAPNGTSVETDEVTITVKQWEISISSQPESCTAYEGDSATLSVTAEYGGSGELSYLWKSYNSYTEQWEDANDFATSYTESAFTVNDVTTYMNDYRFKCVITAPNGTSVETDEVTITVKQWEISISSQPQSCTVYEGESAALSVTAEYGGSGELSYLWKSYNSYTEQWEDANDFATSYTESAFTVNDVTTYMNDYRFKCVITAPNGTSVETDEVVITVKQWEVTITSQPESCTVHEGESATLSVTAEFGGSGELSYLWKSYNRYTEQWEDANDFATSYTESVFTVDDVTTYMNDYRFKCVITAPNGTSVETDEVVITVKQWEVTITSQPESCTVHEGESAALSVTAEYGGSGELTYLWKSYNKYTQQWEDANDFATSYTESSFTVNDVTKYMNDYKFKCIITAPNGTSVETDEVTITVTVNIVASGTCGENLIWTLDDAGLLTISGSGSMTEYYAYSYTNYAPWDSYRSSIYSVKIESGVTSIGNYALHYCRSLTNVEIGDSVTSIGDFAFDYCSSLTGIKIPDSVTSIGNGAFSDCTSLTSVEISESVTSIGDHAFELCYSLTSVEIPDSVTSIGDWAFYKCTSLTSVEIGDSVTSIGDIAFCRCTSLTSVEIPASITSIGNRAFEDCTSLQSISVSADNNTYSSIDGVLFNKDKKTLICCPEGKTGAYSIPNSVTSIGNSAFAYCTSLTSVEIPNSVTSIGDVAFWDCTSLTSIEIPDSVTGIGDDAFYGCTSLTSIEIPDSVTSIGYYAFYDCTSLTDVYYGGTEEQWNKISIGSYNSCLTSAHRYYNCTNSGAAGGNSSNMTDKKLTSLTIAVYENKKEQYKDENFGVCKEAKVYVGGTLAGNTDSDGNITIDYPTSGGVISVEKEGYVTQEFSALQLLANSIVFLEKVSDDYPVISQLWAESSSDSSALNILHNSLDVDGRQSQKYTLTPEVCWGKNSGAGQIKLYQKGITVYLDASDSTKVDFYSTFDIDEPIYVYAINSDGKSVKRELKMESHYADEDSGFSFDFGDKLEFSIPDSAKDKFPFLPDKFSIDFGDRKVPVEFCCENGKYYVAIGYTGDKTKQNYEEGEWKEEVKEYVGLIKSLKNSIAEGKEALADFKKDLKEAKNKSQLRDGKLGMDCSFSIMGFAECYFNGSDFVLTECGVIIAAEAEVSYNQPFTLGPVPMFFEAKFASSLEAQLDMYLKKEIRAFTPSFDLDWTISLSGGLGLGVSKVASVSGGLKGSLINDFELGKENNIYYRLDAALDWYAKLQILFATFNWGDNIGTTTLIEYPDPTKLTDSLSPATYDASPGWADMYNAANYTPEPLTCSPQAGGAADDEALQPQTLNSSGTGSFVENAYSNAAPQFAVFEDGTRLAVWVGLNPDNQTYDGLSLYYSYYNGEWSSPKLIDSDGTMDASPSVTVIGDKAYIAWQDAAGSVNDCGSLEDIADRMGISAAVYDKSGDTFTTYSVTTGGALDTMPQVYCDSSAVYVIWVRNSENDWFGQSGTNSIMTSTLTADGCTAPAESMSGLGPILGFDAYCSGGECSIACTVDTDSDCSTADDVEIYVNGVQKTSNEVLESGVSYMSDGTMLWYSENCLVTDGNTIVSGINTDRIKVVDNNGIKAVLFPQENGLATVIYAVYCNDGEWGSPVPIYDEGTSISQFDADVTEDGKITMLVKNQEIVGDYESENPYGECSLDWYNAPMGCDLELSEVLYDASGYIEGESMNFALTVRNSGELTADKVSVKVTDSAGNTVYDRLHLVEILSGQEEELNASVAISDVSQDKSYTVTVSPYNTDDADTSDNSKTVKLSWNDLSVENLRYVKTGDGITLYASVANRGYDEQSSVKVTVYEETPDGTVLAEETIDSIASLNQKTVSFTLADRSSGTYYVCIEHPEKDNDYSDDSDFIVIAAAYTVSYDANGGSDAPQSQNKKSDKALTLTEEIPAREGYCFLGWATSDSAIIPEFYSEGRYEENKDTVLYAVWSLFSYGDANNDGKIDVMDANYLRRAAAGLIELTDEQKAVADIYADGRYNALDVNLLRRYVAQIVTKIPYITKETAKRRTIHQEIWPA